MKKQKPKTSTQLVDDDFIAYVWSFFVRHPGVVVGLRPEGIGDVWVAPPIGKKMQTSEDGGPAPTKVELEPLNVDLHTTRYQDLVAQYDDSLRVTARRESIFEVLTGSHVLVSLHFHGRPHGLALCQSHLLSYCMLSLYSPPS